MTATWTRKPIVAALGLAGTLFFAVAGCGGKSGGTDEAVVITDPSVTVPTAGTGAPAPSTGTQATPAASTSNAPAASAPAENVKAEGWGTLKGQITFSGEPPASKNLRDQGKAEKDPEFCAKDGPIPSERLVVDSATKGVKNVLVYIPKPSGVNPEAKSAASQAEVEFDQEKCVFKPHVLGVMAGAKIAMKNSDPVNHNIDSKLKNNATNPNIPPGGAQPFPTQAPERTPGEVVCDIHPWMKAYWMVIDSPYFAVTDAKGNFTIKNVPAGTQKVVVWQESVTGGGFVTPASGQSVNVKADGETTLDLKIDAAKIRPE
jgi:plastocyanin